MGPMVLLAGVIVDWWLKQSLIGCRTAPNRARVALALAEIADLFRCRHGPLQASSRATLPWSIASAVRWLALRLLDQLQALLNQLGQISEEPRRTRPIYHPMVARKA